MIFLYIFVAGILGLIFLGPVGAVIGGIIGFVFGATQSNYRNAYLVKGAV